MNHPTQRKDGVPRGPQRSEGSEDLDSAKTPVRSPGEAYWPVYVPTRGRAGRLTPDVLALNPTLILEGPDRAKYQKAYPDLKQHRLGETNRGVSYARNFTMTYARADGCEWIWMLDDDLFDFQRRRKDRDPGFLEPAECLAAAQKAILGVKGVGLAGLPCAWAKVGEEPDEMRSAERIRLDVNCYSCVALHLPSLVGLCYREELKLREDTDFSLQVLFRGLKTVRVDSLSYQMPVCGTGTGGLAATYANESAKAVANRRLAEIWPGICHTGGDCKTYWIDWRKAAAARRQRFSVISREEAPIQRAGVPAEEETTYAFALPCAGAG